MKTHKATTAIAIAALTTIGSMLLGPVPSAHAQGACLKHDAALAKLSQVFDERVSGRGLTNSGQAMVELLTSADGSWTVVATDVHGQTCVVASGVAWTKLVAGRSS